jgi:molybdenum cofactor cytidylyltransferase
MTGLIILAAGESSRLGRPKQNLEFEGQTLLQRAVETGIRSKCDKIIVVLGANSDKIKPVQGASVVYNKDWAQGMASSIKTGMGEINDATEIKNVIIMLCDQPFVDAGLLNTLISRHTETGKPIVACEYNGITGVPVLFDHSLFSDLLLLQGTDGAKKILRQHPDKITTIPFEKGSIDIDTPEDVERLQKLSD